MGTAGGTEQDRTFEWTFRAALWARPTAIVTFAGVEAVHVLSAVAIKVPGANLEVVLGVVAVVSLALLLPLVAVAVTTAVVAGIRRGDRAVRLTVSDQVRILMGLTLFAYAVWSFLALQAAPVSTLPRVTRLDPEAYRVAVLEQLQFVSAQLMVYVGVSALYLTRGTRQELAARLRRPGQPVVAPATARPAPIDDRERVG
jgi:uncharacterized membrane protein YjgN (DUF898 family)